MCNSLFKKLIEKFRKGDATAFGLIYEQFKKLILFYGSKIGDDDTVQELNIFLIELLYDIDLSLFPATSTNGIQKYIAVSIRNEYLKISQRNARYNAVFSELYETELSDSFADDGLFIDEALSFLSQKQRLIILYKYIYSYTDSEIAIMLGISRQAVNRLKNRALSVLKEYYIRDDKSEQSKRNHNISSAKIG